MSKTGNPLEIYKLLQKSNCGKCQLPTCMAFSVAVVQGRKRLGDCPHLESGTIERLEGEIPRRKTQDEAQEEVVGRLREQVSKLDLASVAARLGATLVDGRLAITCLGKDFLIDRDGNMASVCHVNTWVQIPLLNYIIHCRGREVSFDWMAFGALDNAEDWGQFFSHRCEEALRQLADAHQELVFEILTVFGAKAAAGVSSADHALVIYPLPRVPFLINYWQPEDDFDSKLNILFDSSATANLNAESIYLLGRGLVEMFRQLIVRHSRDGKLF